MKKYIITILIILAQAHSFASENENSGQQYEACHILNQKKYVQNTTQNYLGSHGIQISKPYLYTAGLMAVEFFGLLMLNEHDSDPDIKNFKNAYRDRPRPDDDTAFYNLFLHPIMGSETYLHARKHNYGIAGSIIFSFGASFAWEYLVESWTEHPSLQDLIFTSGIGWILGEMRYYFLKKMKRKSRWILDPVSYFIEHFNVNVAMDQDKIIHETIYFGMLTWNI